MTMLVEPNRSLLQWILGWAERVEVMEPMSLRVELADFGRTLVERYGGEAC
jgi:predicted DNA-binding transcriptional regulator YafY